MVTKQFTHDLMLIYLLENCEFNSTQMQPLRYLRSEMNKVLFKINLLPLSSEGKDGKVNIITTAIINTKFVPFNFSESEGRQSASIF